MAWISVTASKNPSSEIPESRETTDLILAFMPILLMRPRRNIALHIQLGRRQTPAFGLRMSTLSYEPMKDVASNLREYSTPCLRALPKRFLTLWNGSHLNRANSLFWKPWKGCRKTTSGVIVMGVLLPSRELSPPMRHSKKNTKRQHGLRSFVRDLDDIGIPEDHALSYHNFIIDWFVRAVGEGRLLQQCREALSSVVAPQDRWTNILPPLSAEQTLRIKSLKTDAGFSTVQEMTSPSCSASLIPPRPVSSKDGNNRSRSFVTTPPVFGRPELKSALPKRIVPARCTTCLKEPSNDSDKDSLYALPPTP